MPELSEPDQHFFDFPRLPPEIRLSIWKQAIKEPNFVLVQPSLSTGDHSRVPFTVFVEKSHKHRNAMLSVNHEARQTVLEHLAGPSSASTTYSSNTIQLPFSLSFKSDLFFLACGSLRKFDEGAAQSLQENTEGLVSAELPRSFFLKNVQNIGVDFHVCRSNDQLENFLLAILSRFKALEQLVIIYDTKQAKSGENAFALVNLSFRKDTAPNSNYRRMAVMKTRLTSFFERRNQNVEIHFMKVQ